MSPAQIEAFLREPRHAIVGVIRADGAPQLSPVWILAENGKIYFSILVDSAKYHQLMRDPRISLCIDAGHPDARAVMIRGRAEIIREESAWSEDLSWRINRRYHESEEDARQYMQEMETQGASALVAVSLENQIGRDFN
jgi:PPOX class probable F420-dependent enzyme